MFCQENSGSGRERGRKNRTFGRDFLPPNGDKNVPAPYEVPPAELHHSPWGSLTPRNRLSINPPWGKNDGCCPVWPDWDCSPRGIWQGGKVAAMLQKSIEGAYGDLDSTRHVRYSLTRRDDMADGTSSMSQETRAMLEGMHDFKLSINQNEDGTYMSNAQGGFLTGASSSAGTLNINDTKQGAFRPRYHYLWERAMGRK